MKYFCSSITILLVVFSIISCSRQIIKVAFPTLHDGVYDSEFPYQSCSEQLEEISEMIYKVHCTAGYKNYVFNEDRHIQKKHISESLLKNADYNSSFHNSTIGTSIVLNVDGLSIAILTCAHVFNKADTLYTYYEEKDHQPHPYIQSISIKKSQINYVTEMPEDSKFEILFLDTKNDVALLGKTLKKPSRMQINVFDYPVGSAKELNWGSFVYIFGFPRGYKMITKGIISSPNRTNYGQLIIDALFNRGMSGGLILAIRDGVPNFEMVGMATSSAAQEALILSPPEDVQHNLFMPYTGDIYIEKRREITYGVTLSVTIDTIIKTIEEHKKELEEKGYHISLTNY